LGFASYIVLPNGLFWNFFKNFFHEKQKNEQKTLRDAEIEKGKLKCSQLDENYVI
jgi:hypothetical protein